MKIKLSAPKIKWLGFLGLVSIITSVVDVGISLYIWDGVGDLSKLIWYHVAMFAVIPFVGLIAGLVTDYVHPRIPLIFSFVAYGVLLVFASKYGQYFFQNLPLFGALTGFAIALQSIPLNSITNRNIDDEDRNIFTSNLSTLTLIIGLTLPLIVTIVKKLTGSLAILFGLVVPLAVMALLSLLKIGVSMPGHENFSWKIMMGSFTRNPDSKSLFLADFLMAFKDGIFWVLRNVLAFVLLESVTSWGIYATLFQLIKILVSKVLSTQKHIINSRAWFLIGGFLYTASTLLLVVDFSVVNFLIFSLVEGVFGVLTSVVFTDAISRLMESDPWYRTYKLETEYGVLREFHLGLGRVFPLLVMAMVFVGLDEIESIMAMKLVFILVGFIPQLLSVVLIKSRGFGSLLPKNMRNEMSES